MSKKAKIKKLRKKVAQLKRQLAKNKANGSGPVVSPLAPKDGFPLLPIVAGAEFAAVEAGIRYSGRPDVMLAQLCAGTTIAGVFTKSATRAASVLDCQAKIGLPPDAGASIIVNSGNANAFTGSNGMAAVGKITAAVAQTLNLPQDRVFSSSTGVIGELLPFDKITENLGALKSKLSPNSIEAAANAIMTTDTFSKGSGVTIKTNNGDINISGIAKGSGMIAPDMATMLVYIFTDAKIAQPLLQTILSTLTKTTFNCITVDSDTSTSDCLILAATGQSPADEITQMNGPFYDALAKVMLDLAHQVVRDGEGATKFVEIRVTSAATTADAHLAAMAIANSPLVKTAVAGEDPNWGRIVMAVGKSGAAANRDLLSIKFGDVLVADKGWVAKGYNEADAAAHMKQDELIIDVDLGVGTNAATVWTCDLTHGYIKINADYRS